MIIFLQFVYLYDMINVFGKNRHYAAVAELADALDSKSSG